MDKSSYWTDHSNDDVMGLSICLRFPWMIVHLTMLQPQTSASQFGKIQAIFDQASHLNKQGLLNIVLWEQRKEQSENRTYSEPDTVE
jgi:hypothetical protein